MLQGEVESSRNMLEGVGGRKDNERKDRPPSSSTESDPRAGSPSRSKENEIPRPVRRTEQNTILSLRYAYRTLDTREGK